MHDMPAMKTVDAEIIEDEQDFDAEGWKRDCRFVDYGLQDGIFNEYKGKGYVLAVFEGKVIGKGKNLLHLRRRMGKKFGVHPLRIVLVDLALGVL